MASVLYWWLGEVTGTVSAFGILFTREEAFASPFHMLDRLV
jgi:hypothetical protein